MANILLRQEAADLTANSSVKEVVVYFNQAQVTREQHVNLQPGEQSVVFTNLGQGIDESSIKVKMTAKTVSVVSTCLVSNQLYFFRAKEDEAKYQAILAGLKQLIGIMDEKTACSLVNYILAELRDYIRDALNDIMLEQEVPIGKLKNALSLLEEKLDYNSRHMLETEAQLRKLAEKLAILKEELNTIRKLDKCIQNNIEIAVTVKEAASLALEVSYLLPGVWWRASYDAKLETGCNGVRLAYYGEVRQQTSEHWENASLVLSTSETRSSLAIPPVYPLFVSGFEQKRDKVLIVQRRDAEEAAPEEEGEPREVPGQPEAPAAGPLAGVRKKGTAYTFQVAKPYTIPADGLWHRVLILEQQWEAETAYETIPETMEYVYLKGKLTNLSGLPLLAGRVSIYRNGSFMGKSELNYVAPGESFALSFGIDEDLKVKRIETSKYKIKRKLLSRNERSWYYKFILYNYKETARQIVLKEAVYFSRINEVSVEILKTTTPGYVTSEDGILSWQLELAPDPFKYREVLLEYKVTAPKSFDLDGI